MNGRFYYNENDKAAAEWLRWLIADGQLPAGDVDDRSIVDVRASDLRGYVQCHFFAGIGGWGLALRLAGWPDDRPVWTGSCPCQPFSVAGSQRGSDDERHLWPAWFRLIRECAPPVVFGEQVAGAAGLAWLDHVLCDLEGAGYAAAAAVVPAGSVGAPHRRERLWFVADAEGRRLGQGREDAPGRDEGVGAQGAGRGSADVGRERMGHASFGQPVISVADADGGQSRETGAGRLLGCRQHGLLAESGVSVELGDADDARLEGQGRSERQHGSAGWQEPHGCSRTAGIFTGCCEQRAGAWSAACRCPWRPWRHLQWLHCSDGKARPTQPGLFPLVDGLPRGVVPSSYQGMAINANQSAEARVARLRGYGNAIVPQVAAEFIGAFIEARGMT